MFRRGAAIRQREVAISIRYSKKILGSIRWGMGLMNEFPSVMHEAKTDLGSHAHGDFSPTSWANILCEAERRLRLKSKAGFSEQDAWAEVVREFHREDYWGHRADWIKPKPIKNGNTGFGVNAVLLTLTTFVFGLMAVVWLGQLFTISDEPLDAYKFYLAVIVVVANILFFLWRSRNYQD